MCGDGVEGAGWPLGRGVQDVQEAGVDGSAGLRVERRDVAGVGVGEPCPVYAQGPLLGRRRGEWRGEVWGDGEVGAGGGGGVAAEPRVEVPSAAGEQLWAGEKRPREAHVDDAEGGRDFITL